MKENKRFLSVLLAFAMIFSLCSVGFTGAAAPAEPKNLVVYFSNWGEDSVEDLPWDRLSYINHAFWEINPVAGK